ncbi:MAG: flagellar hook-basal body complex protein FliE [Limnochordales bacterium]|nr:flagellar hook-basal body complex protein FliE [Limnochordales bacterium]
MATSVLTDEIVRSYLGYSPKLAQVANERGAAGAGLATGLNEATGPSFGELLKNAIDQVEALQQAADQAAWAVATGDPAGPNLAQVVQLTEEAALAVSLVVAVRNRALEAYQEIMRMQV